MKNTRLFILFVGLLSCAAPTPDKIAKIGNIPPYSIISDRNINLDTLVNLINNLDTIVNEPSSFWADIANDTTYHPFHRAECAFTLMRRHVKDSAPLTELRGILKNPNWIKRENISNRCIYRGGGSWKFPSKMMGVNGSIFCIRIFPGLNDTARFKNIPYRFTRIRIGLSEIISMEDFCDFILKGKTDSVIKKTRIVAIG